jgi:hypothetical protein
MDNALEVVRTNLIPCGKPREAHLPDISGRLGLFLGRIHF